MTTNPDPWEPYRRAAKALGVGMLGFTVVMNEHDHTHNEPYEAPAPESNFIVASTSATSQTSAVQFSFDLNPFMKR